jgi:hypothetical protein
MYFTPLVPLASPNAILDHTNNTTPSSRVLPEGGSYKMEPRSTCHPQPDENDDTKGLGQAYEDMGEGSVPPSQDGEDQARDQDDEDDEDAEYWKLVDMERDQLIPLYNQHDRSMSKVRENLTHMTKCQAMLPRASWRHMTILAQAQLEGKVNLRPYHKKVIREGRIRMDQGLTPFERGNWPDPIEEAPDLGEDEEEEI